MSKIRWAAWGVVDIEKIPSDHTSGGNGQARRSYLKQVRAELAALGFELQCGGAKLKPWYKVLKTGTDDYHVAAGPDAFKNVMAWVLQQIGDTDVSGEDGGVRRAGDEAQVGGAGVAR
jgi:hypothetical protein